ncbi:Prolyl oligopeptidase family protein [Lonsdalea quercina]|uniref:Prolyl oligopeptidase family protein n=1 Tax=Lonsdalea quercina TaxID=71657 RepID=A0A1H4DRL6_9GAMM|nr:Prolyl oligopeptidase family protein [Lonsdalea quercina]
MIYSNLKPILLAAGLFAAGTSAVSAHYPLSDIDLSQARAGFQTELVKDTLQPDGKAETPPVKRYKTVQYPSPVGELVAYLTPDPKDGKRHPAVVWAHGGYGGIGSFLWEPQDADNDQSGRAFPEAGIVTMMPSWRGENDNPGKFEMFYGEINDLHAARDYLAKLPYVDPDRIYLAGHSTGGTMTLLGNEYQHGFRAAFSLGGVPDLELRLSRGPTAVGPSFNTQNSREFYLRSPRTFITHLKSPTYYFEGSDNYWEYSLPQMEKDAQNAGVSFHAYSVPHGDHFSIILPVTRLIAQKILRDTGEQPDIEFSPADIEHISHEIDAAIDEIDQE